MERLQAAIEKARAARRERGENKAQARVTRLSTTSMAHARTAWSDLSALEPDDAQLSEQRIVTSRKSDPAHVAFDVLRTRLMGVMAEKGWRRVMITSPSEGCGKSTVAVNLAMSLARNSDWRTLLMDMDLRNPQLARRMGCAGAARSMEGWLRSDGAPRDHLLRVGDNLAVGLNARPAAHSAELLHDVRTVRKLDSTIALLDPAAVIYDVPAMLVSDDTIGFLPQVDCVLLVAAAGQTTANEIEECERLLEGTANFLGVLLNKCAAPSRGSFSDAGKESSGSPTPGSRQQRARASTRAA